MAQVLAPIVQTSSPITMPYSSPDAYSNSPNQTPHAPQRASQMPRTQNYGSQAAGSGYRGTSAPIAPYAFSSTPQLRQESRSTSASVTQGPQQPLNHINQTRLGQPSHISSSSDSTVSTSGSSNRSTVAQQSGARDGSNKGKTLDGSVSPATTMSDSSFAPGEALVKPSPGRYRRAPVKTDSSSSVTASLPHQAPQRLSNLQQEVHSPSSTDSATHIPVRPGHHRASSADDTHLPRNGGSDAARRYRRRSFNGLDANVTAPEAASLQVTSAIQAPPAGLPSHSTRPSSSSGGYGSRPASSQSHERQGSAGSGSSNVSSRSQSRHDAAPRTYAAVAGSVSTKAAESTRRHAPSPLSHPVSPSEPPSPAKAPTTLSPAVKQLTAVNEKDKGMKSRLRRAFSFGSAAELRRASVENSAERARLRKDKFQGEDDPEQAAIIAKQEAAGIGAGIYSGQGGVMGSTDNISISSAASSASIMLRKMGQGVKRGSRSIKGLFRPKSVIGVPAADGPLTQASIGEVTRVNVEAERQRVNVNPDPHDQAGGGTGYPRLERNSVDASRTADAVNSSAFNNDATSRKSNYGGDRERAEILSSIKKGILKRNGTGSDSGSPVLRPVDSLQNAGSVKSDLPGTPTSTRNAMVDDYFARPPRILAGSTRSLPNTPQGSLRSITFSPRIQFHDAWSPQDYDRRGDIATCNRLTPMLAQQIKEELNSFKMEMEVHAESKFHTHFF